MSIFNSLLSDYKLHKKTRTTKHSSYPARFLVPDDQVSWKTGFPAYHPVSFNAPIVMDVATPWADPPFPDKISRKLTSFEGEVVFNENGFPLNPFGRSGLSGRGVLGKWGANFAVDGLITTCDETHSLKVLTIVRKDTGETAIPGGMTDPNESVYETRNRELAEEIAVTTKDLAGALYEKLVFRGYADDPRNTDNAWIETSLIHSHLPHEVAANMMLSAGDDAKDYHWIAVTIDTIKHFYASHGFVLLIALKEMLHSSAVLLNDRVQQELLKLFDE